MIEAGWYGDPTQRYAQRYHDGTRWTEHVEQGGQAVADPAGAPVPVPDAGGPAAPQAGGPGIAQASGPGAAEAGAPPGAAPQPGWPAAATAAGSLSTHAGGGAVPAAARALGYQASGSMPASRMQPGGRNGLPGPLAWAVVILGFQAFVLLGYGVALLAGGAALNSGSTCTTTYGSSTTFCDDAANVSSGVVAIGLAMALVGGGLVAAAVATAMAKNWGRVVNYVAQGLYLLIALYVVARSSSPNGLAILVLFSFPILVIVLLSAASSRRTIANQERYG